MAIPTYEELMLPLLNLVKDGNEYSRRQVTDSLANEFRLTDEEKTRMLPSGKMTYIYNRTGWAKTSLKKAGLLEQPISGRFRITQRGLDVLKENPSHIDVKYLSKFPEYVEFQFGAQEPKEDVNPEAQLSNKTPDEMMDTGYKEIQETLYDELVEKIKSVSDKGFEMLVLDLCKKMSYGELVEHTGKSGDQGIDDKLYDWKVARVSLDGGVEFE